MSPILLKACYNQIPSLPIFGGIKAHMEWGINVVRSTLLHVEWGTNVVVPYSMYIE